MRPKSAAQDGTTQVFAEDDLNVAALEPAVLLGELLALGGGAAFYEYDFGDSWLHRLELVASSPVSEGPAPARLVDGARRGGRRAWCFVAETMVLELLPQPLLKGVSRGCGV
ncbi:hypothetical protein R5O87_04060 [Arthrobacter globiformis]|uniref:IS1096 element passenger TnpR family protein n=1 Tax=Arthrobacter globiformis TaxID=1665 RepID=UPI00397C9EAA